MISITLWSFDKKKNSTKIPSTSGNVVQGELKQNFTLTGLEVTFDFGALVNAPTYNYAYIPQLRRYYFITDWYYNAGLWIAVCAVDVLATYKTEIGNSTQYVTRAYSSYNPNIIDSAYFTKADGITRDNATLTPTQFWGASAWGTTGTIVVGVVGATTGTMGAVTYYAMAVSTFADFMASMLTGVNWLGISATEISEELQKALINPTQYIVSCRWFPVLYSSLSAGVTTYYLSLGWWTFTLTDSAKILNTVSSAWITRTQEVYIPKNPQALGDPRLAYLDLAPYSTYMFKFLPFGVFEIDTTELYDKATLGIHVEANLMTGDAVLKLCAKTYNESYNFDNAFLVTEGQIGVTLPVGQISADVGKYKNALIAGGASAIASLVG